METNHSAPTHWRLLIVAAALTIAAGCGRNDVKVYKVDSSDTITTPPPVAVTTPAGMPTTMPDGLPVPDNSGLPKLKYTLPDGWKEKQLTQLRVASFDISEAGKSVDVSVIPLGPQSGGDAANVNRWRGQVGQQPLDEADLKKSAETVQIGGKTADLYDVAGTNPGSGDEDRVIGVILHTEETTWYFKMMGNAALAEKNKPAFISLLKTLEFQSPAPGAMPAMDMSQLPPSHPPISGMGMGAVPQPAPASTGEKPTWTVPPGWKEGELMQFLTARYVIEGSGDATAAVNISESDGDGGGLLPNLNRWRMQLGQAAITDKDLATLPTIQASSVQAPLVEFTGTDARSGKPARLVGVVLPLNGQTWFYKMMGDPELVAQQKEAFIAFVQSAKYPAN